ncbi:MAG TPA: DNA-directed RNA polymerase subunit alpha [Nitrospirales bacterium]|nr:DNA-directed RNA polymerase subunit alpha [Nitrospirales bacterium]HIO21670.1 DNA-directed RNA polymerase subunit alpha [Nitrospirales bacterium]
MLKELKGFNVPGKIEIERDTLTPQYGKIVAEPLERGFGTTLGNTLRRVILSSLYGAAVTSVKIEGVLHEFSTIRGVTEDVTEIILNIKNLRLKLHTETSKTITLKKKGPGEAKGSDITHDGDVEILTPDLHIATLDKDAVIDIEMVIQRGRGYVPSERHQTDGLPIGVIPVDAIFTPTKRVNFHVENARVGQITDYDKLILEIWTDGSVHPEEAVSTAAKILKGHLDIFIPKDELDKGPSVVTTEDESIELNMYLARSVNELELSVRAANCLKNAKIKTIGDLVQKTEAEMLRTKNFGKKSLNEIKEMLVDMGLGLGMKPDQTSQKSTKDK